jgi:hypothetical protein
MMHARHRQVATVTFSLARMCSRSLRNVCTCALGVAAFCLPGISEELKRSPEFEIPGEIDGLTGPVRILLLGPVGSILAETTLGAEQRRFSLVTREQPHSWGLVDNASKVVFLKGIGGTRAIVTDFEAVRRATRPCTGRIVVPDGALSTTASAAEAGEGVLAVERGSHTASINLLFGKERLLALRLDATGQFFFHSNVPVSGLHLSVPAQGLETYHSGPWRPGDNFQVTVTEREIFVLEGMMRATSGRPVSSGKVQVSWGPDGGPVIYTNSRGYFRIATNLPVSRLKGFGTYETFERQGPWAQSATVALGRDPTSDLKVTGSVSRPPDAAEGRDRIEFLASDGTVVGVVKTERSGQFEAYLPSTPHAARVTGSDRIAREYVWRWAPGEDVRLGPATAGQ